jgi:hypothetical protein
MADVFVSYAKTDRPLASKLVAMLEAEGWSVWWDTSLGAADLYRDDIMRQLVSARAVIAIWTPNSIRSDWVRAEAGAAKKDGKLIPVKTPDLAYADIPLPFGEMHTENVEAAQLIRAAVVAQLAKPVVEPTAWTLLAKGFKWELLTWWGIIGGAITLFVAISTTLKLADWARVLVQHWKEWTHAFWVWVFGWLGIHLRPEWAPILSFLLFGSLLAIGQAVKFKSTIKHQPTKDKYHGKSFHLISWRSVLAIAGMFVALILLLLWFVLLSSWPSRPSEEGFGLFLSTGLTAFLISPIVLFARHKLHAAISTGLVLTFFIIITLVPLQDLAPKGVTALAVGTAWLGLIWILPIILLSVAPAKAISRRLIFLALGLLLLIALNELSKFGFDLTAPKQG